MFIYKITNTKNNKCYIGFDTKPEHKQSRWKTHQRECVKQNTKFYKALYNNMDDFTFEIIDKQNNIGSLVVAEIKWIAYYNSYTDGYNSTFGGDGLNQDLSSITDKQYELIIEAISGSATEYNTNIKWANTTANERKELTKHLHNDEIYEKKSKTLKENYKHNPDLVKQRSIDLKNYWNNMTDSGRRQRTKHNKKNSLLGAAKVSKKVKILTPEGDEKIYQSKSAFAREHGYIINNVIKMTLEGSNHKGYQGWEIE